MGMTRDQAERRAHKLGKNVYTIFNPKALDAEERAPVDAKLRELRAQIAVLRKEADGLMSQALGRRCRIMRAHRMPVPEIGLAGFTSEIASGDTWEECFAKLAPKQPDGAKGQEGPKALTDVLNAPFKG